MFQCHVMSKPFDLPNNARPPANIAIKANCICVEISSGRSLGPSYQKYL